MQRYQAKVSRFQKAIAKADWPTALKAIDGLIKEQPRISSLHYNRGLVLKNLDRPLDALQAFDMVLQLDPSHANAAFERGGTLFNLSRFEEAVPAFELYIEREPDDADAALNLGLALTRIGRPEEARSSLRKAHELAANTETTIALATAERDCGDLDAMEQLIGTLGDDEPEIAAAILKLRTHGACGRLSLEAARA